MGWMGNVQEAQSNAERAMCLAEEAVCLLRTMSEEQGGSEHVQFTRRSLIVNLDGTGAGVERLDLRAGADVHLISYAGTSSTGSTGVLLFYMDGGLDPTSLMAVAEIGQYFSDQFAEGDTIPDGRDLAVQVQGGPPNGWVVVNVSAKIVTYKRQEDY